MPKKDSFAENISGILNSIGVSYLDEDGKKLAVKTGKLSNFAPLHSKVKTRLYVEFMGEGGSPYYHVIGVITEPMTPSEVIDMKLKAEFNDRKGKKQIWINELDFDQVKVVIPSGYKTLSYKSSGKKEKKENYFPDDGLSNLN